MIELSVLVIIVSLCFPASGAKSKMLQSLDLKVEMTFCLFKSQSFSWLDYWSRVII